ncbi:MAG: substrate-binding domain-containing protein [Actinobacteria bacterium]|nr:substrate-binding domain-containing protein [Actinomycetota bacterium]
MKSLRPLITRGKGMVAVILPDTVTSARYTEFDAPFLTKAFEMAGFHASQFIVENAQGSRSTELSMAESAITKGATVLAMDPLDSGVGVQIEKYSASHGVKVINYDRLALGSTRNNYYVSFNNIQVGKMIGQGFATCVSAWHVNHPQVLVMRGSPHDNNATLYAQGYNSVLKPYFSSGKYIRVGHPAGTWQPDKALTIFQEEYTAHPSINAAVTPNDEDAAPIINYLKNLHVPPRTFPVTGQDATLIGLQNILAGYQCGTVYKPIYLEAQATVALAAYLRAGLDPPSTLLNATTYDPTTRQYVQSVLLKPEWITAVTMAKTVIADRFVPVSQLCTAPYADACYVVGITSKP